MARQSQLTAAPLPRWSGGFEHARRRHPSEWVLIIGAVLLTLIYLSWPSGMVRDDFRIHFGQKQEESSSSHSLPLKGIPQRLEDFQKCSLQHLRATNYSFLKTAKPLSTSEFVVRRDRLAQALVNDGMDAFIVEPGYTFSYYANVTQPDWEVWEPEERPFLMIVQPQKSHDLTTNKDIIRANTTFLVPSFEAERARLLGMPIFGQLDLVTYEEHWNPYETLLSSSVFSDTVESNDKAGPKIMVDEEMRDFISRGLATNGFNVHGLGGDVERVRQTKSDAEVEIIRAVNTGTVESVRAMRKCLLPGLTEADVTLVLDNTMRSAGMDPFFDIVLFDENAANPHGGTDGAKVLEEETMVLIDVGAHLYGYSSDICRSFFPPFFSKPETDAEYAALSPNVREKLHVWDIVLDAQTASMHALHVNGSCASVDLAARGVIEAAGYGDAFTHRVGHGIGIKAHESPYLNKGNRKTLLKAGMTFTSEPGIYLVDRFGVRHEDILLVKDDSLPEILTGERAKGPWNP